MKSIWYLVAIAAALPLVACGGGASGDDPLAPPAAGASAPAAPTTVTGPDGSSITVPAGAFAVPTTIRIAKDSSAAGPLPAAFLPAGDMLSLTPNAQALRLMATLRVPIDPATPPDAAIAVAHYSDGTWSIRTDGRRIGDHLELRVWHLGQYRAVRLPARAGTLAFKHQVVSGPAGSPVDFRAPGFSVTFNIPGVPDPYPFQYYALENPSPYDDSTAVRVTARLERDACPNLTEVRVEIFNKIGSDLIGPLSNQMELQRTPVRDFEDPLTFDLRVYRHLLPDYPDFQQEEMIAIPSFLCDGGIYVFYPGVAMRYRVTRPDTLAFLESPSGRNLVVADPATFDVRIVGGPPTPPPQTSIGGGPVDQYELLWERSNDDGAHWVPRAYSLQSEAIEVSPSNGKLHRLTLAAVAATDNGALFRAKVCYREQCVVSDSARLTVIQVPIPAVITRQPRSIETLPGQTADFSIGVAGMPQPSIRWQMLGQEPATWLDVGTPGATWPGATPDATTLVTQPASLGQGKSLFRAIVSNKGASVTSAHVAWRVNDRTTAPTFTVQPASSSAPTGTAVLLEGAAEGTAPLSYQWFRNDVPIAGATSPLLSLPDVQADAVGIYRLVVSGPGGSTSSVAVSVTLSIGPAPATPPLISMQPSPATVPLGMATTFRVAVTGSPPPACQWTRNGIVIPGAASCDSYTTPPATAADNGAVFNVVATNAGGSVFAGGAVLTVQGIPPSSSWTFLPTGTGENLYDVTIIGGDPKQVVAVGQQGSILRSTDGGVSWTRVHVALSTMYRVRFIDANVGVAVGVNNIARTADGGATWETVWYAPNEQAAYGAQSLHSINWVDANTAIAIGFSRVWRSTDRGATWSVYGSHDFAALGASIRFLQFGSSGLGLAGGDYRLFRTTDGGLTWNEVALPFNPYMNGLVVGSTDQDYVMVGADGIHRSVDGGLSWASAASAGYLIGVVAHGNRMTAVGEAGLVMNSSDDGATWTTGPIVPFGQLWGVDFAAQTTFVSGSGGVLARHD